MAINPHITFKAGICDLEESRHVIPRGNPGYIYLYSDDDQFLHFCWRPRSAPVSAPELDLIMVGDDGSFVPYQSHGLKFNPTDDEARSRPVTTGRLFVLKFTSSSDRYIFWLQSQSQEPSNLSHFGPRDLAIGRIVNDLLKGSSVNVQQELADLSNNQGDPGGDGDAAMEDADGAPPDVDHHRAASGGAGADATGGDIRDEGEEAREGGANGGRAAATGTTETQTAVADFLQSLRGSQGPRGQDPMESKTFTTLSELLQPSTTLPVLDTASESYLDELLSHLPPATILLATSADEGLSVDPDPETVQAVIMSLDSGQKRGILAKVLRSPQFSQSLGSLTMALRDGGLPTISEALKINLTNGGYLRRSGIPLGGGEAVETFIAGVKVEVEKQAVNGNSMDTSEN